jgi:DNA-binding NarL/FixJ family response regulator
LGGIRAFDDEGGIITHFARHDDEPKLHTTHALGNTAVSNSERGPLNERQLEVLEMTSFGWSRLDIAKQLFLSPLTIDHHKKSIISALNTHSSVHAVRVGFEKGLLRPQEGIAEPPEKLSSRQTEVLFYASFGLTNEEIAKSLYISIETVKRHFRNIKSKVNYKNRPHMVRMGFEQGYLSADDSLEKTTQFKEARRAGFWDQTP